MFGSNSPGSAESSCGPVHQRPPANSRGSSTTGIPGYPASRYHRLTSVCESGPTVGVTVTNTGRRPAMGAFGLVERLDGGDERGHVPGSAGHGTQPRLWYC
jgi:hypothetical protein